MLADQPFEGRDPRFVLLKEVGRGSVLVEGARLVSFDPDTDQIAREIVALLQTVERFASQKLLRDLTLKFDAVRAIPDHELSSFESPACRSNVKSAHVRPQGPTPVLQGRKHWAILCLLVSISDRSQGRRRGARGFVRFQSAGLAWTASAEGERPRSANRFSKAVRPSDYEATLRATIERVVISRTTIEIEFAEGVTSDDQNCILIVPWTPPSPIGAARSSKAKATNPPPRAR